MSPGNFKLGGCCGRGCGWRSSKLQEGQISTAKGVSGPLILTCGDHTCVIVLGDRMVQRSSFVRVDTGMTMKDERQKMHLMLLWSKSCDGEATAAGFFASSRCVCPAPDHPAIQFHHIERRMVPSHSFGYGAQVLYLML